MDMHPTAHMCISALTFRHAALQVAQLLPRPQGHVPPQQHLPLVAPAGQQVAWWASKQRNYVMLCVKGGK